MKSRSFTKAAALLVGGILIGSVGFGGAAEAGKLINGKFIKRGTVASKQIKDLSITTDDLAFGVGAPGSRLVLKTATTTPIAANGTVAETIDCNANSFAVSGGALWIDAVGTTADQPAVHETGLLRSAETDDRPNAWTVSGKNTSGGNNRLKLYVICAPRA